MGDEMIEQMTRLGVWVWVRIGFGCSVSNDGIPT